MFARVYGWFSKPASYDDIPGSQQSRSSVGGLFKSTSEDGLLAKVRASGDGKDAFAVAEFYFRKEDDSSFIKGAAWLLIAIQKNCTTAATVFLKDKLLFPSESIPGSDLHKSNALSRFTFIAMMLLGEPLANLESSGWLKSWKEENRSHFVKFNHTGSSEDLLDAIKRKDADALFLLNTPHNEQKKVFNEFFSYCFDNHFLDLQYAEKLGITYSPTRGEKHGEATSLLGGDRSHRKYL